MPLVVTHRVADIATAKSPLFVALVPKGPLPSSLAPLDKATAGALSRCWATGDFTGAKDETALLYPGANGLDRVLLIGLGESDKITRTGLRRAAMIAGKRARTIGAPAAIVWFSPDDVPSVPSGLAGQSLAEGVPFGAWHYPDLKRPPESPKPVFERCELVTAAPDT
ncbi:MAG: M17 family peptidase N-terminal domain-containing protein, partial [Gemmatimonadota bacterium]